MSVLFIVVVLAALGGALATVSFRQQLGSANERAAAQALQAARAGLEWAGWQVLRNPPPPASAPGCFATTSFTVPGAPGMTVTVGCTRTPSTGTVDDGATALAFFQLVATACNAPTAGACPSAGTPSATYVERQLSWTISR